MISIRLVAEKRSPFAMSEISERKLFARRANSAAGRACMPNLFRIVISRVTVTGSRFWRHLISRRLDLRRDFARPQRNTIFRRGSFFERRFEDSWEAPSNGDGGRLAQRPKGPTLPRGKWEWPETLQIRKSGIRPAHSR